jgi:hypothetical protein
VQIISFDLLSYDDVKELVVWKDFPNIRLLVDSTTNPRRRPSKAQGASLGCVS